MKKTPVFFLSLSFGLALAACLVGLLNVQGSLAAPAAPESATAHVAVQFAPGDQLVRPIQFTAPISGLAALQLSSLEVEVKDYGGGFIAVCSIGGVGCPASDCFCAFPKFWNYEYWDGGQWQGHASGPAGTTVSDGAVEGWRWAEFGVGALPAAPQMIAAAQALAWLQPLQSNVDGGYGGSGVSAEALLSIASNHLGAAEWKRSPTSPSLLNYFLLKGASFTSSASAAGKLAVGMSAAKGCWPDGARKPADFYTASSGVYESGAGPQAWAILGQAALSQTIPVSAVVHLQGLAQANGGWEWYPGFGTDTNTTALAIQALVAAGQPLTATEIISGVHYLAAAQNADGGFPYDPTSPWGSDSDANSTAYVIQAILASGGDPLGAAWQIGSSTPVSYLLSLQLPDGSFEWQSGLGSNLFATQQAIPALLGRTFPLAVSDEMASCTNTYLPVVAR